MLLFSIPESQFSETYGWKSQQLFLNIFSVDSFITTLFFRHRLPGNFSNSHTRLTKSQSLDYARLEQNNVHDI
jgi:hypothetical protein